MLQANSSVPKVHSCGARSAARAPIPLKLGLLVQRPVPSVLRARVLLQAKHQSLHAWIPLLMPRALLVTSPNLSVSRCQVRQPPPPLGQYAFLVLLAHTTLALVVKVFPIAFVAVPHIAVLSDQPVNQHAFQLLSLRNLLMCAFLVLRKTILNAPNAH